MPSTLSYAPNMYDPPPVETGCTFADNARQKALYYCEACAMIAVAEESNQLEKTLLKFYLDGIQYALGDLDVDATPSARKSK